MTKQYYVIDTDAPKEQNTLTDEGIAVPIADGPFAIYEEAKNHAVSPWREVVPVEVNSGDT